MYVRDLEIDLLDRPCEKLARDLSPSNNQPYHRPINQPRVIVLRSTTNQDTNLNAGGIDGGDGGGGGGAGDGGGGANAGHRRDYYAGNAWQFAQDAQHAAN